MAEIPRSKIIDCIGVQLSKGAPLSEPVSILKDIDSAKRPVECPFLVVGETICTAADLEAERVQCVQLPQPPLNEMTLAGLEALTPLRQEVLMGFAKGQTAEKIASESVKSAATVRAHSRHIKALIDPYDSKQTEVIAIHAGILPRDELAAEFDFSKIREVTPPEREALAEVSRTDINTKDEEIAKRLFKSKATIRSQLNLAFKKIEVKNRTQAAVFTTLADMAGVTDPDSAHYIPPSKNKTTS